MCTNLKLPFHCALFGLSVYTTFPAQRISKHARCFEVVVVKLQAVDIWTTASWSLCALLLSPL
jgi:hypothetical protein